MNNLGKALPVLGLGPIGFLEAFDSEQVLGDGEMADVQRTPPFPNHCVVNSARLERHDPSATLPVRTAISTHHEG